MSTAERNNSRELNAAEAMPALVGRGSGRGTLKEMKERITECARRRGLIRPNRRPGLLAKTAPALDFNNCQPLELDLK